MSLFANVILEPDNLKFNEIDDETETGTETENFTISFKF